MTRHYEAFQENLAYLKKRSTCTANTPTQKQQLLTAIIILYATWYVPLSIYALV